MVDQQVADDRQEPDPGPARGWGGVRQALVTAMVIGIAFGAVLLASAPAIVLYFGLPAALGALGAIHSLSGTMEWINSATALEPLTATWLERPDR